MYYYPNRPSLIPPDPNSPLQPKPDYINSLEAQGKYVAEKKWNGDNVMIHTDIGRHIIYNRQGELLKYTPPKLMIEELNQYPNSSIINAELMHFKTIHIKNTLIVHCVLAWDGQPLFGKTWADSRILVEETVSGTHVHVSELYESGFWELFQSADGKTVEGIILKDPNGKLQFSIRLLADVSWMLKIRKPCKKYSF